ncbi:MAG: hypothetical protein ACE5R3_03100 [Nitrosopumilaceae archaeon]
MVSNSRDIRTAIEAKWNEYLSKYGNLFSSDSVSGTSPPSVFVGTYNYPKVNVGPMVPPIHGDTGILDAPERWTGKSLDEIVNYRLNLVRGIQKVPVNDPTGRYIENLQELAMSERATDSDVQFTKATSAVGLLDGYNAPFGPIGEIKSAKFSNSPVERKIEKVYYDRDLLASDAVLKLYNSGIDISQIQKCFSIGMMGKKRKLVPTRWSITATDDIISNDLVQQALEFSVIDRFEVYHYEHLGNLFSVVLFPHRWLYEMIEAWYSNGVLGFGSDHEGVKGIDHSPEIAGAYYSAKLAVAEHLVANQLQSGALVLREIRPEYAIPVGVWQIREGVREAMKQQPVIASSFENALDVAAKPMSISRKEWLEHGSIVQLMKQKTISDFF